MKKCTACLIGLLAVAAVSAQDIPPFAVYEGDDPGLQESAMDLPPFGGQLDVPPPGGPMPPPMADLEDMHNRRRGPGGDPVRQWLEHVRRENPEEYERLQILREEDPQAFRNELGERLKQKRASRGTRGDRPFAETIENLPPDHREEAIRKLHRERNRHAQETALVRNNPEIRKLEAESRSLAKEYRAAVDHAERDRIKKDLRVILDQLFDMRSDARREAVEQMEVKLNRLQEQLRKRDAQRDAIIERRLQDLTERENLDW